MIAFLMFMQSHLRCYNDKNCFDIFRKVYEKKEINVKHSLSDVRKLHVNMMRDWFGFNESQSSLGAVFM